MVSQIDGKVQGGMTNRVGGAGRFWALVCFSNGVNLRRDQNVGAGLIRGVEATALL
jgi:hypothetical protein